MPAVLSGWVRHGEVDEAITADVLDAARRGVALDLRHLDRTSVQGHLRPEAQMLTQAEALAEGLGRSPGRVEVEGLSVHGHGREQGVVRLGDGASGRVLVGGADFHLVQPQTSLCDDLLAHVTLLTSRDLSLSPFTGPLRPRVAGIQWKQFD